MRNEIALYSEEMYIDKLYLYSLYSNTTAELIWRDVLKYREYFHHTLNFDEKKYYLTMNQTLFDKMLRIYEYPIEKSNMEYLHIHMFVEKYANADVKTLLLMYANEIHLSLKGTMIRFLCSDENLLIKIFIAKHWIGVKEYIYLILLVFNKVSWYHYIYKCQELIGIKAEKDLTFKYRSFLDQFYYCLSNTIDLSSARKERETLEELLLRFPMCNKMQLEFYLTHSHINHYYTVTQYMEYHQVSYETARKAMNLLVNLEFYKKSKVGKRQVYRPL